MTYGLASCRLVSRSDVCLAMASETDALLLRDPVAFAPQPNALPAAMSGGGPGAGGGGGSSPADLVAFMVTLRSQVGCRGHGLGLQGKDLKVVCGRGVPDRNASVERDCCQLGPCVARD